MKVIRLKRSDAVDQMHWRFGCRNRPTPEMRGQQTGLHANDDCSKMKKSFNANLSKYPGSFVFFLTW